MSILMGAVKTAGRVTELELEPSATERQALERPKVL